MLLCRFVDLAEGWTADVDGIKRTCGPRVTQCSTLEASTFYNMQIPQEATGTRPQGAVHTKSRNRQDLTLIVPILYYSRLVDISTKAR